MWKSYPLLFLLSAVQLELQSVLAVNPACECVQFTSDFRSHGSFTSPNFPQIYQPNINCILYTFSGDASEIIELTFMEFDLQLSITNKCTDYLRFYLDVDRPQVNEQTTWNYDLCGNMNMIPKRHYSSTSSLVLELHTDAIQTNSTGFRGIYSFIPKAQFKMEGGSQRVSAPCAYDFRSSWRTKSGRLFSPQYPQNYPPNSSCQYFFHGLSSERVKVTFGNIQLEKTDGSCSDSPDFVVVRDGLDVSSTVIAQYCNSQRNEEITSSGPFLYIDFIVDGREQRQGFEATYQFEQVADEADRGGVKQSSDLGLGLGHGRLQIDSKPVHMQVVVAPTGADSETYTHVERCDHEFVSSITQRGTFSSPKYPNSYPGDVNCKYTFSGRGRERVQIIFNDIDLHFSKAPTLPALIGTPPTGDNKQPESGTGDQCDDVDSLTVTVNIGGVPRDIGIFCGYQKPPKLMSNDNRMEVSFVSRTAHPRAKGFSASYEFVTDFGIKSGEAASDMVCGFVFESKKSTNGTFTSPNFPGLYPRNTECHYLFYGGDSEVIYITFPYFDVEGLPPACADSTQSDYVEFSNFNVKLIDRKMYRLCGTKSVSMKQGVTSDGNFFRVTFKSNDAYDKTGFEAFYQFRRQEDSYPSPRTPTTPRSSAVASIQHSRSTSWSLALATSLASLLIIGFVVDSSSSSSSSISDAVTLPPTDDAHRRRRRRSSLNY